MTFMERVTPVVDDTIKALAPREESRPVKPKTLGGLLSKKDENIVIVYTSTRATLAAPK